MLYSFNPNCLTLCFDLWFWICGCNTAYSHCCICTLQNSCQCVPISSLLNKVTLTPHPTLHLNRARVAVAKTREWREACQRKRAGLSFSRQRCLWRLSSLTAGRCRVSLKTNEKRWVFTAVPDYVSTRKLARREVNQQPTGWLKATGALACSGQESPTYSNTWQRK